MVIAIKQAWMRKPGGRTVHLVGANSARVRSALLRSLWMALLTLLLLAPLPSRAGVAENAKPAAIAKSDDIVFREAVSQYRKRDYRTSFQTFDRLARAGHPGARYYLGVMYGLGQGTGVNWQRAYTWLSCAAHGTPDRNLRIDASQQRALVRRKLSRKGLQRAQAAAQQMCQAAPVSLQESADKRVLFNPVRASFVDHLMFSAGDVIVMSVLFIAQRFDLALLKNMALATYKIFGDWFIGLLSALWWLMFGRMAYLLLATTGGQGGRRQAGMVNIMSPRQKQGRYNKFTA